MIRREFVGLLGGVALHGATPRGWDEVLGLPRSSYFGLRADGSGKAPASWYRADTEDAGELSFDVSNGMISASISARGEVTRACICEGLRWLPEKDMKGGVYSEKILVYGGPWASVLAQGSVGCDLLGGVFPLFSSKAGRWLYFAPLTGRVVYRVSWVGSDAKVEALTVGSEKVDGWDPLSLFWEAWEVASKRYGVMRIPERPVVAEMFGRYGELARQSLLRSANGQVCGGFLGSDVDTRKINWNKDSYYSALAMSWFAPELCRDAIPFFMKWNVPERPVGRGIARFPNAGAVTQSLSNAVAPLALAGAYYKATGDAEWFRANHWFLRDGKLLLERVLASKRGKPMLFPSMFISDGDARGDYHTGSNVVAWYAFRSMARLAGEVYGETELAKEWMGVAEEIRRDLDKYCVGEDASGVRFFEGVMADGTFLSGHDGEESDVSLMPFYGFCGREDARLVRHSRLAFSGANQYYSKELDAVWWHNNGDFRSATAPAFVTALVGAATQSEVLRQLQRMERLTDLDGSIWWWPYPYGAKDPTKPLRGNSARKCGWAASTYLIRFVHDVLGMDVDVPARRLVLAGGVPWDTFSWEGCRLGSAMFDVSWDSGAYRIRNRNAVEWEVVVGGKAVRLGAGEARSLR